MDYTVTRNIINSNNKKYVGFMKNMSMNPDFELKEKLTSDTIFSFLNAYTERYVRINYLQEDQVLDGTRAQKKNADALKGLIVRGLYEVDAKDSKNTDKVSDRVKQRG